MKYVFLVYTDEGWSGSLSAAERDAFESACLANDAALRESGYLLAIYSLHGNHSSITVQAHNGAVILGDGSFAQTRKQLIGLFFIHARDLNEAIHVASRMPQAYCGPIEVRAVSD